MACNVHNNKFLGGKCTSYAQVKFYLHLLCNLKKDETFVIVRPEGFFVCIEK